MRKLGVGKRGSKICGGALICVVALRRKIGLSTYFVVLAEPHQSEFHSQHTGMAEQSHGIIRVSELRRSRATHTGHHKRRKGRRRKWILTHRHSNLQLRVEEGYFEQDTGCVLFGADDGEEEDFLLWHLPFGGQRLT